MMHFDTCTPTAYFIATSNRRTSLSGKKTRCGWFFSDFGIASLSEASIRFTRGAGTLHYAAPEQIVAAATVTGKTDYWSLGMILFEMLAGRHPFSELGEYAIAAVIATGSTGTGGNLPFETIADPKWRTLCQGLLVRDPQQRWGSDEVGRWLQEMKH